MLSWTTSGSFDATERFLQAALRQRSVISQLDGLAREGVAALRAATPKDSGDTSSLWHYEIQQSSRGFTINWTNSNIENGFPVALMLQLGHATRGGGYVQGRDYINPAMKPIFDKIAERAWKAVTSI